MSQRSSLLGRNGFHQIPERNHSGSRSPTRDATIDIPMTSVKSHTGSRKQQFAGDMSEKESGPRAGPGRRKGFRELRGRKSDVEDVNGMGRVYNRILNFSIITRYFLYILPVGLILAVPIVLGAVIKNPDPPGLGGVRIIWIFAWALTMWVGLWASKLFAKTTPYIFSFLCGIVSPGTRKYSTILKALEIPLSLVGWAVVALATFQPVLTNNPFPFVHDINTDAGKDDEARAAQWEQKVQQVLAAALFSAGVYLLEKVLIQIISVNYHRMQYDMKIKESKTNVQTLCVLYDASIALFPAFCPEFQEEDYVINDSPELAVAKGHKRSGSATPMRLLANVGRLGDKVTAAFGSIAHEVTGKDVFNPTASHSVVVEALEKKRSSEALAKRIWMSLVVEGKEALYQEDIIEVLHDRSESEAVEAFDMLDQDGNGDVNLDEMIMKVCEIGRTRKSIASSLHDVDQAINVLDNLLLSAVLVVVVFIFIAFLNESLVTTLATTGTALLSLSFIFSATAAEILGSCIFLFVKHPFDVGDMVTISTNRLVVDRISLLYTVFINTATHTTTQCPNAVLNTLWIDNISRSKAMREQLVLDVSFDTTLEDVQLLQKEMQNFVRDKDNGRDFEPDIDVELTGVNDMSKLELRVEIRHKSNWSNGALTAARRSKFMCALVLALRKVPIYAPGGGNAALGSADQPSYSVAVSNEQAEAARDAFAKGKADKHMKVIKSNKAWNDVGASFSGSSPNDNAEASLRARSPQIGPNSETAAMNALNTRSPTADIPQDWQSDSSSPINRRNSSRIRSPHLAPIGSREEQRNKDIDEVYGVLRRASTRGKRRESLSMVGSQHGLSEQNSNPIPIIEEPTPPATVASANVFYHDYAREVGKSTSPPRDRPKLGEGAGFGATYSNNTYVSPAPKYEYPPASRGEGPAGSSAGQTVPPAPITSSSVYPSPLRSTGTTPQQEQSMNPTSLTTSPPRNNRNNAYAAELDGYERE